MHAHLCIDWFTCFWFTHLTCIWLCCSAARWPAWFHLLPPFPNVHPTTLITTLPARPRSLPQPAPNRPRNHAACLHAPHPLSRSTLANKVSSSLLFLACIAIMIPSTAKVVYGPAIITRECLRLKCCTTVACELWPTTTTRGSPLAIPTAAVLYQSMCARGYGAACCRPLLVLPP